MICILTYCVQKNYSQKRLEKFIRDKSARRISFPPTTRSLRRMAHYLCEQYGLTTISQGSEPRRHIEAFKGEVRFLFEGYVRCLNSFQLSVGFFLSYFVCSLGAFQEKFSVWLLPALRPQNL